MTISTVNPVSFLSIAEREIAAGIPVIPIQAGQKSPPLNPTGASSPSTDPQQIAAWAELFPDANVGVVCTLTGICIVDDDEGLVNKSGIPVVTRVVESSPGHRQYYFRHTAETAAIGNLGQRGGFSLRSHNYYGLAAGSRHPDGHLYTLLQDAPIALMPAELLQYLIERHRGAKSSLSGDLQILNGKKLREGEGRNDDMTRLAGLIWDGQDEEEFFTDLKWACELRHDPPYPDARIRDVVRRAMRDWDPCPGFDLADLLPDDPELHGYWIGLTVHSTKKAFEHAQKEAQDRKPRVMTLTQLDAQIKAARSMEELVTGMLPIRSVNIIGGDSGLGKSPLVCQLAVCVAAGLPFLGHEVRKSPVLIADYENDAGLSPMLHSVTQAVGAPESIHSDGSLGVIQRPEQHELIEAVNQTGAKLVIVDSLRGLDPRAESAKNARGPELIAELQDVNASWLLIHHLRKPPSNAEVTRADLDDENIPVLTWLESLSGHRSLVNQTFTRMAIDRTTKKKAADLIVRGFKKGIGEFGPIYLERIYNDGGEPIGYKKLTGAGMLTLNQKAELQKVLAVGDDLTFGEIATAVGGKSAASRLLSSCRNAGLVTTVGRDRQKDKRYQFRLPDEVGNM